MSESGLGMVWKRWPCLSLLALREVLVAQFIPWLSLTTPVGLFLIAGYTGEITLIT